MTSYHLTDPLDLHRAGQVALDEGRYAMAARLFTEAAISAYTEGGKTELLRKAHLAELQADAAGER